jgi:cell wall-associated NlpC family hydrolase
MTTRGIGRVIAAVVLGGLVVAVVAGVLRSGNGSAAGQSTPAASTTARPIPLVGQLTYHRLTGPARTQVVDTHGDTLAVFTDGARTVRLTGPTRVFTEPRFTKRSVTTDAWVRLAPQAWHDGAQTQPWFTPWLTKELADTSPDVFGVATQYLVGAPPIVNSAGLRIAGDASFGPLSTTDPDGREERSDFYDYLGVSWTFPDGKVSPQPDRYGDVDCSGFLRLVYGYRMGYPLRLRNEPGDGLPRRAYAIAAFGPGVLVIPNRGVPAHDFDRLQPGDLVFFRTATGPGDETDHSGIFLGVDDEGHYRFISSRSKADGPTFGDFGGAATLDGDGYWSVRFRTARRL